MNATSQPQSGTPDESAPATAQPGATLCPLCGGPNGCEAASTGCFPERCWCVDVKFAPTLLAKVPPEKQGKACICRRCAQAQG